MRAAGRGARGSVLVLNRGAFGGSGVFSPPSVGPWDLASPGRATVFSWPGGAYPTSQAWKKPLGEAPFPGREDKQGAGAAGREKPPRASPAAPRGSASRRGRPGASAAGMKRSGLGDPPGTATAWGAVGSLQLLPPPGQHPQRWGLPKDLLVSHPPARLPHSGSCWCSEIIYGIPWKSSAGEREPQCPSQAVWGQRGSPPVTLIPPRCCAPGAGQ